MCVKGCSGLAREPDLGRIYGFRPGRDSLEAATPPVCIGTPSILITEPLGLLPARKFFHWDSFSVFTTGSFLALLALIPRMVTRKGYL